MRRIFVLLLCVLLVSGCAKEEIKELNTTVEKSAEEIIALADLDGDGNSISKSDMQLNPYETLCVPTQFTKINDNYFIVDCYHNQILVSKDRNAPLAQWHQMSCDMDKGHSIAGDGVVYMCDDTENNRVLVYMEQDECFYETQVFEAVGTRPHYCIYDEKNSRFLVLSSLTGEIYIFKRELNSSRVVLSEVKSIPELAQIYVRSFTCIDDKIYFPAGDGYIYVTDNKSFKIKEKLALAPELGGPVQLSKINEYYYLTVSTDIVGFNTAANIVRGKRLEDFAGTEYESVRSSFCDNGTPYVITQADEEYYLTIHSDNGYDCLWRFDVDETGELVRTERLFDK